MCDLCEAMDPEGGDCSCGQWFRTWVAWTDHAYAGCDGQWTSRGKADWVVTS